ncbi:Glyoxylate/succinic semialdehyde reductase 1 [Apostasia shenzhenica]|uniref:Glyoxylate/succinic semialdehyde reductase 1 n=1 Tax=Apostasia shenzhenica TaxID=1088818 RepID=A0A2H9ZVJ2_9ASPA|nr:Glyoxylate/succinic semialdehyde reductase 1 [Apostasia shenzhenica]
MEVGFLGLGIMGKAMAVNLLRSGFRVTVWNRTLPKCEELVEHGASIGESPAAVVRKSKYTIAMLADPRAALSVVFEKDGVLEQICEGKDYIDMSTVDVDTSSKINEEFSSHRNRVSLLKMCDSRFLLSLSDEWPVTGRDRTR